MLIENTGGGQLPALNIGFCLLFEYLLLSWGQDLFDIIVPVLWTFVKILRQWENEQNWAQEMTSLASKEISEITNACREKDSACKEVAWYYDTDGHKNPPNLQIKS